LQITSVLPKLGEQGGKPATELLGVKLLNPDSSVLDQKGFYYIKK
jgi:hypothetical protein